MGFYKAGNRNKIGNGVAESEVVLHIIGRQTHKVDESHDEEAEHYRQNRNNCLSIHIIVILEVRKYLTAPSSGHQTFPPVQNPYSLMQYKSMQPY